MTECQEIAYNLLESDVYADCKSFQDCANATAANMPDETHTVIDEVAYAAWRYIKPLIANTNH